MTIYHNILLPCMFCRPPYNFSLLRLVNYCVFASEAPIHRYSYVIELRYGEEDEGEDDGSEAERRNCILSD